jgi:hypothetical protein
MKTMLENLFQEAEEELERIYDRLGCEMENL